MRKFLTLTACVALLGSVPALGAELVNLRNGFSIRTDHHQTVGDLTRLYTGADANSGYIDVRTEEIAGFEDALEEPVKALVLANTDDLKSLVSSASQRLQVDADMIASVIRAESGNNARAVSPKGARGLMQLMPGTAGKLGVKDSFDPAENIDGGSRYLRELLIRYNNDMVKALAAYNAGPQRVEQYHGVPPYRETRAYVARVITDYNRQKIARQRQQPKVNSPTKTAGTPKAQRHPDGTRVALKGPASSPLAEPTEPKGQ